MDTFHIKIIFHQEFSKGIGVPCSDMLTSVPDMFTLRTANLIFFKILVIMSRVIGAEKSDQTLDNTANITARSTFNHFKNLMKTSNRSEIPKFDLSQLCVNGYEAGKGNKTPYL
jgi:hypothetical protein